MEAIQTRDASERSKPADSYIIPCSSTAIRIMPLVVVGSLGRDDAPQMLSRQGRKDSCVFSSAESGVLSMGYKEEARAIHERIDDSLPANLPSTKSKGKSRRPPTKKNGNNNVQIGCNVTHKVHLMWPHVADQMKYVSGGLDKKMEDWVERQH